MNSKTEVSQVLNNIPQGSQLTGRPRNGSWNCVQKILIDANLKTAESGQKTDLTWRNPLRTRRWHWTVVPSKKKKKNIFSKRQELLPELSTRFIP